MRGEGCSKGGDFHSHSHCDNVFSVKCDLLVLH